ncbi:unnamed protein product [Closterium sp. Yama58-4]|nr:unnamed protein product [Closterium sp. Yama58-4]
MAPRRRDAAADGDEPAGACAAPIPPTALLPLLDPAFPAHLCGSWHSDYAALHSRIRTASVAQYAATSTAASHTADGADAGVTGEAGGREDTPVAAAAPLSAPLPSTNSSSTSPTGPPPLRFLTYDWLDQCGGLGDSLVGLATSFAVALLDDRAFLIRHACLPWAFQPALVDWTLSPDVPLSPARTILRDKLSEKKQWEEWQGEVQPGEVLLLDLLNRNANPDWFFLGGKGEGKAGGKTGGKVGGLSRNAVNVRVRWNRGMLTRMLAGPWTAGRARRLYGMGMRLPYAFGCILRFLFKPNQEVWARVQAVQQQLVAGLETGSDAGPLVTIGLHIRVPDADVAWQEEHVRQKTQGEGGDSAGTATAEEVATGNVTMTNVTMANAAMGAEEQAAWMKAVWKWLACAEAVESFWLSPSLSVRWLLVTNSARLKLALKGKYPHKVVTSSIIPRHSNLLHTNQLDTSGFSASAAFYSLHPTNAFLPDKCVPETPLHADALGRLRSGV